MNLKAEVRLKIRFSETDAMGVVWHGNYLKFFEDAREYFGEKYKMTYLDVYRNGYFTPLIKTEVNHKKTLDYGDNVLVETNLEFSKSAKIIHHFKVFNADTKELCATGTTIQVFMDAKTKEMQLYYPDFYQKWLNTFKTQEKS